MNDEKTGKEHTTSETSLTVRDDDNALSKSNRSKPSLVMLDGRRNLICTDGKFHPNLAVEYLLMHARDKWITIGKLCGIFYAAQTIAGKRRVRRHMPAVVMGLLAFGEFLVYETDASSGQITAVKLFDARSEQERQAALPQLQRMRQRREMSARKYEMALQVIKNKELMAEAI